MKSQREPLAKKVLAFVLVGAAFLLGSYAIHQRWKLSRGFSAYVEDGLQAGLEFLGQQIQPETSSQALLLLADPDRPAAQVQLAELRPVPDRPERLAVLDAAGRPSIVHTARSLLGLAARGALDADRRDAGLRTLWDAARPDGSFAATLPPSERSAPLGEVVAALALAPDAPELREWLARPAPPVARVAFLYVASRRPKSPERLASMEALASALQSAQLAPRGHPLLLGAFEPSGDAVLTALGAIGVLALGQETSDPALRAALPGASREAVAYLLRSQVPGSGQVRPRFAPPDAPPPALDDEVLGATAWSVVAFRAYLADLATRSGP